MAIFTITMFITRVPCLLHKFMSKITKGKLSTMTSSHRNTDYAEDVTFLLRNHISGSQPLSAASTFVHHIHLYTFGIDRHYFSWVLHPIILNQNPLSDLNVYLLLLLIFLSFLFLVFVFLLLLLTLNTIGID